jgi:competence protein ComEA
MRAKLAALVLLALLPITLGASEWEVWKGCRLIPNDYNDADSFNVEYQGQRYIIRLYFVDAPETDNSFPDRVAEQARHHGKTDEEVIHIGRYSSAVAAQLLSNSFSVITRRQDARGRSSMPRFYGFVTTSDGEDLGEVLVASGLARSYGAAAHAPGRRSISEMRSRYDALEQSARKNRYGIYSPSPLRAINRADSNKSSQSGSISGTAIAPQGVQTDNLDVDSILPEPTISAPANPSAPTFTFSEPGIKKSESPSSPTQQAPTKGKVNINTASSTELQTLPGIGPKSAERIIDGRPYSSVEDLRYVPRIPQKTFDEIIPLCTVD